MCDRNSQVIKLDACEAISTRSHAAQTRHLIVDVSRFYLYCSAICFRERQPGEKAFTRREHNHHFFYGPRIRATSITKARDTTICNTFAP